MKRRGAPIAGGLALALAMIAPAEASALSRYGGVSDDGSRVFFDSAERLVAQDTDDFYDVYERSGGTVSLISTGVGNPSGAHNARFVDASADGTKVFFNTTEALAATDSDDGRSDVYMRSGGATTQISLNASAAVAAEFNAASTDGSIVYFSTNAPIAGDTDNFADVFRYSGAGTITPMTPGTTGNAFFAGATPDGAHVYFHSDENLAGATDDGDERDVFEGGSPPQWLSFGPASTDEPFDAGFLGASNDGSKVFMTTKEPWASPDARPEECMPDPFTGNNCIDVYQRSGGVTTLISTGPADDEPVTSQFFRGISADGSKVFFSSTAYMIPGEEADGEGRTLPGGEIEPDRPDTYMRSGGTTTLMTPGTIAGEGSYAGSSADGSKVFFAAVDPLAPGETDSVADVYLREGGTTTLISQGTQNGNGAFPALFAGNTPNGSTVFFETREALTADDTDPAPTSIDCFGEACTDVYARTGNTTTLISAPGAGAATAAETGIASFDGATPSGGHVFFSTTGALVGNDTDSFTDVYQRAGGATTLLRATGPPPDIDPPETTITKQPKKKSSKRKAKFEFTSDEAGSTFICTLDGETQPCTSPHKTGKLSLGKHKFEVFATDPAGNDDATPESVSFKVVKKKKKKRK